LPDDSRKIVSFISCKKSLASVIEQTHDNATAVPAVINKPKILRALLLRRSNFKYGCYEALTLPELHSPGNRHFRRVRGQCALWVNPFPPSIPFLAVRIIDCKAFSANKALVDAAAQDGRRSNAAIIFHSRHDI
jgi:hypothetical protein